MANMYLGARNRRWPDENTATMARLLDNAGFGRVAETIIQAGLGDGQTDREIQYNLGRQMGYDLAEAYDKMRKAGGPLGHALLIDPWDFKFDHRAITAAYIEAYGASDRAGSKSPKGKASNNSRPKAPAKARNTTRRR